MRILPAQKAFPIVMVATLAAALLPGQWLARTNPPAEFLGLLLTPFADLGNRLGERIRPPRNSLDGVMLTEEYITHLQEERAEFERLYLAEQAKVESLESQLRQLQNAPADLPNVPVRPVLARIGLRAPAGASGVVTLNRGSRDGIAEGTIAVYEHINLVGRVREVSSVQCTLVPLTNAATGELQGAVIAHDRPGAAVSLASAPKVALKPRGDGTLFAEPPNDALINVGDEVRLSDESWPRAAQGMRLGIVEEIRPNAKKPLRNYVVVRPQFQVSQVGFVVLRAETDDAAMADGGLH